MATMPAQSTEQPEDRWETIKSLWKRHQFLYVLAGFLLGLLAYPLLQLAITDLPQFLSDLAPEAVSTLVAVLVIDRIYRIHADKERLRELITQMRSQDNGLALAAVDLLKLKGWLTSKTLQKAYLFGANLQGVVLSRLNMQGMMLMRVNFEQAHLSDTNLERAFLRSANFVQAFLVNTNLREARLGGANLEGAKLWGANLQGADLEDVKFNERTILPDKSIWAPGTDMSRFTDPNHPDFWRSDDPASPAYRGDQSSHP